jgi:multimeric flavodoxin WrbA
MSKKIIAFNGSPRKTRNTATLLQKALDGAKSAGASTELVHLYDLKFKGCVSCFSCKRINGKSYGRCAHQDDLTPFLKKIENADGILIGSPIYLGTPSGEFRSLIERLLFPFITYTNPIKVLTPKKIPVGLFLTMNVPPSMDKGPFKFGENIHSLESFLELAFGKVESLYSYDTYQLDDYSVIESSMFNAVEKKKRRENVFPLECQKAFDIGRKFCSLNLE